VPSITLPFCSDTTHRVCRIGVTDVPWKHIRSVYFCRIHGTEPSLEAPASLRSRRNFARVPVHGAADEPHHPKKPDFPRSFWACLPSLLRAVAFRAKVRQDRPLQTPVVAGHRGFVGKFLGWVMKAMTRSVPPQSHWRGSVR
jgi:hypothetical protein